jgi:hypothetical protein
MTLWVPEWRVKINQTEITTATLSNLTITSGRTDIYSQPTAGYCSITLVETNETSIPYEINDGLTIEIKKSDGAYVPLFGGFITDLAIQVGTSGTNATRQNINIIAVGALARLARSIFDGNIASDFDGDQIYELLSTVLFDQWNEVPAAETWNAYDPAIQWEDAENSGLGEIDRPGDYDLDSQNSVTDNVYDLASGIATSGLGYLYEDSSGRIGYADSTHRSQYLATFGYVDLDGSHALAPGMAVTKRAGDVRNSITIAYTSSGNSTVTDSDAASISDYGQLATNIRTTLKNQNDAEDQAAFYLLIRAYPQFQFTQVTFPLGSTDIDNADRDALLQVFMGLPVNIQNLPGNMVDGEFQGFVEGWTFSAGYKSLSLRMTVSPIAFSLQAFRWNSVPVVEQWATLSPTLDWLNATIVA